MLGKGYIKLNGETIPNPTNLKISLANSENIKQSETAEDIGTVTRLGKRTFQFSFQSTSYGRDKIKAFCMLTECVLTYKNEEIAGRLRITGEAMLAGSEYAPRTDGLWTLTVNFIEK